MGDVSGFLNETKKDPVSQMSRKLVPRNTLAIIQQTDEGTVFQCVECSAKFHDKGKIELHLLLHNNEYRFLCGICGAGLKRKEHLDRHTLGHQEVRPHVCSECGKGFKRKEHLNIHRTIHSGAKSEVCPLCNRSFHRKDHLQKHLLTHNKQFMDALNEPGMLELKREILDDDIRPVYYDESMMMDETRVKSEKCTPGVPTPERPYACQLCEKTYKRKDHLKMHTITHQAKDKVCPECGKAFHKEDQLMCHMNTHVRADDGDTSEDIHGLIPVDHTQIEITPIDDLLVPMRPDKRPHECPICLKRFKRRQHLKVHANVHARPPHPTIWCSLCSVGFRTNEQFENHDCVTAASEPSDEAVEMPRRDKKENQPEPEFVDFSEAENTSYLEEQCMAQSDVVEERLLPRPQRVYVCKFCGKPFRRKDHYKIHLHIHTGVKSFFCVDCGKGFYRKDHLQKHALVHMKNKQAISRARKQLPALYPINMLKKNKAEFKPEITITAPSNVKLRVPLQIKVPYQVITAGSDGATVATHTDEEQ